MLNRLHSFVNVSLLTLAVALCVTRGSAQSSEATSTQSAIFAVRTDSSGTVSNERIFQGSASDGATDGAFPRLLWVGFAALLGLPLAFAGLRLGRFTVGCGLGLVFALSLWAAFVNTMPSTGLVKDSTDVVLAALAIGPFAFGLGLGLLLVSTAAAGLAALGSAGGASIGTAIAILRPGLTVPIYAVNVVIVGLSALIGIGIVVWRRRIGMIIFSAAAGSFLIALAIDLIVNKTRGMSHGLRTLFDRNQAHIMDLTSNNGYDPPLSTQIIVGTSLVLILPFTYIQHRQTPYLEPPASSRHRPASGIIFKPSSFLEKGDLEKGNGSTSSKRRGDAKRQTHTSFYVGPRSPIRPQTAVTAPARNMIGAPMKYPGW